MVTNNMSKVREEIKIYMKQQPQNDIFCPRCGASNRDPRECSFCKGGEEELISSIIKMIQKFSMKVVGENIK